MVHRPSAQYEQICDKALDMIDAALEKDGNTGKSVVNCFGHPTTSTPQFT
jgi:hypothetical protein